MQISVAEARPPFVEFGVDAILDSARTAEEGHPVYKDIEMAFITPMGSKDRIPRVVDDWFSMLEDQVRENRFEASWLNHYKAAHKAWKEGKAAPITGVAISNWPGATPSQVKLLESIPVRSVEELAAANEELIARLGMGGRILVQKARDYLAASKGAGKLSEELSIVRAENARLAETNENLAAQLAALSKQVEALTPKKL